MFAKLIVIVGGSFVVFLIQYQIRKEAKMFPEPVETFNRLCSREQFLPNRA